MNEPFNLRMFWFNIFGILILFAISGGKDAMLYAILLILVVLTYILMTAIRIHEELKRIADYLRNLKKTNKDGSINDRRILD